MATLLAALKAFWAAWSIYKQEKDLHNRPDMVAQKVKEQKQEVIDRLNEVDRILADPNATPQQHADALRALRLAHS